MLQDALNKNIIPALLEEANKYNMEHNAAEYKFLSGYTAKIPAWTKVMRWVHYLGLNCGTQRKSYYGDGHEYNKKKSHRSVLTTEYLTGIEPCSHWGIKMKEYEFKSIQKSLPYKEKIWSNGKMYNDPDLGEKMIEFHVNDHHWLQQRVNKKFREFGGAVSVCMPQGANPIIFWVKMNIFQLIHIQRFNMDRSRRRWINASKNQWYWSDGLGIPVNRDQFWDWNFWCDDEINQREAHWKKLIWQSITPRCLQKNREISTHGVYICSYF